jgi:uncharacterized protein (TIGR02118 family)
MVKAVVLYGPPEDPDVFERYYADTHSALAQKIPGLQRFEAARGFATPDGSAVAYQRIAELTFEDMNALQAGFGSEEGQAGRRGPRRRNTAPIAGASPQPLVVPSASLRRAETLGSRGKRQSAFGLRTSCLPGRPFHKSPAFCWIRCSRGRMPEASH